MAGKRAKLELLQPQLNDPGLWDNPDNARRISQEASQLTRIIEAYDTVSNDVEGLAELYELAEGDEEEELAGEFQRVEEDLEALYRETLFSGDHDERAAIVTIKPVAGGTESASDSVLTACPPNCWRIAAIIFMVGESSCCDTKRANSAAEMVGTGTPRSTAAFTVQRPSPESAA